VTENPRHGAPSQEYTEEALLMGLREVICGALGKVIDDFSERQRYGDFDPVIDAAARWVARRLQE
jgi:hypothetical protein